LCRNLFIYFDEEKKQEALYNLHKLLKPKGYLLLGHADIIKSAPGFEKVEATLLRKL
jgi:chemotaxis methyl-accepting protein methylase